MKTKEDAVVVKEKIEMWWWRRKNYRNVVVVVVVEKTIENVGVVAVWLCYSRSCVEINFECGLDVGLTKGRYGVDVVQGK